MDILTKPRWGQLTYSTFPPDGSAPYGTITGGYAVGAQVGQLNANEQAQLINYAITDFKLRSGVANEMAPTPVELRNRPIRLTYVNGQYWYSIPAGIDSKGRPGAVFNQAFLDRSANRVGIFRPIDLWNSSVFLKPFGANEVGLAKKDISDNLQIDSFPKVGAFLDFLKTPVSGDRGQHRALLFALLDGVQYALKNNGTVVLGVDDANRGASWISTITHLTSAQGAGEIGFSCLDTVGNIAALNARGIKIVCVPRAELIALANRGNLIVFDETEKPELSAGVWSTNAGSQFPETNWSRLVQKLIGKSGQSPEAIANAVSKMDELPQLRVSPKYPESSLAIALCQPSIGLRDNVIQESLVKAVSDDNRVLFLLPQEILENPAIEPLINPILQKEVNQLLNSPDAAADLFEGSQSLAKSIVVSLFSLTAAEMQKRAEDSARKLQEAAEESAQAVEQAMLDGALEVKSYLKRLTFDQQFDSWLRSLEYAIDDLAEGTPDIERTPLPAAHNADHNADPKSFEIPTRTSFRDRSAQLTAAAGPQFTEDFSESYGRKY